MVNQTMISAVLGIERGVCINVLHYLAKVTVQKQHSDM